MTPKRDPIYEKELIHTIGKVRQNLDKKSRKDSFDLDDYYACERMLQILIETLIGLARYTLKISFQSPCSKSSEAFDELFARGIFNEKDLQEIKKIVGYRNILVHDYLNTNPMVTYRLVKAQQYHRIQDLQKKLFSTLNLI